MAYFGDCFVYSCAWMSSTCGEKPKHALRASVGKDTSRKLSTQTTALRFSTFQSSRSAIYHKRCSPRCASPCSRLLRRSKHPRHLRPCVEASSRAHRWWTCSRRRALRFVPEQMMITPHRRLSLILTRPPAAAICIERLCGTRRPLSPGNQCGDPS